MKLLVCTQAVDEKDPILGFFVRWLSEFALRVEELHVICLREGTHTLPPHVQVHTLGEGGRLRRATRFVKLIYALKDSYGGVFVHMNPEYVVLGAPLWRTWGKQVALWYEHKNINLKLRLALLGAHMIFSASDAGSRFKSRKKHVLGHGIDVALFPITPHSGSMDLITVGRISPTKRLLEMLYVLDFLHTRGQQFTFTIVGSAVTDADKVYEKVLVEKIYNRPYANSVRFAGAVEYTQLPALFQKASVNINLSQTGSLDKAVLDGFAAGVPAVSTNIAFKDVLEPHGLFVSSFTPQATAEAIVRATQVPSVPFRAYVSTHHSLPVLIERIVESYEK